MRDRHLARGERIEALAAARPDLNWSSLAAAVGVSYSVVWVWRRSGSISPANARKLAAVLGCGADDVTGPPIPAPAVDRAAAHHARPDGPENPLAGDLELLRFEHHFAGDLVEKLMVDNRGPVGL